MLLFLNLGDPCSHARDTTKIGGGFRTAETRSAGQREHSLQPLEPGTATESGSQEGRTGSQEVRCREMDPDGSTAHRGDSKEEPSHGNGGRIFTAIRGGRKAGQEEPQDHIPGTGNRGCSPGEALRRQKTEYPGGPDMASGKRGGLTGAIPEALSGEAPKGQPMIRGETLKAVCVEAPKGQPRNHRRHSERVMSRPTRGKGERRRKTKDPWSSQWKRTAEKENGGCSPGPLHGEQAPSGCKRDGK